MKSLDITLVPGPYTPYEDDGYMEKVLDELLVIDTDVILAPEFLFSRISPYSRGELQEVKSLLATLLEDNTTLAHKNVLFIPGTLQQGQDDYFYNTAFAFAKGKELFSYNKSTTDIFDDTYASQANKTYRAGDNKKNYFTWNDLDIGLEICRDHGMKKLYDAMKFQEHGKKLDMHIILSYGLNGINPDKLAIREGGIAVLVDGQRGSEASGILRKGEYLRPYHTLNGVYDKYKVELE